MAAAAHLKSGQVDNPLITLILTDPAFAGIDLNKELEPSRYVGRSAEQVDEFLAAVVAPIRGGHTDRLNQRATLDV
jgi:adenylosuccinate lyase